MNIGKHMAKPSRKPLCLVLALAVLLSTLTAWSFSARAAGTPTSLGLAEHGLMAFRDGWQYTYGAKGDDTDGDGVRESDCAGLIYSYYKDLGAIGNCQGGASSQVRVNCVFSGDIDELNGIPRIHGLLLTMPNEGEPQYPYGHVGIYVGNNTAADNSDSYTDMRLEAVVGSGRNWTAWHVMDNGTLYPSNGWYLFDGALFHYSNCQYEVGTTVDGIVLGEDGIALDASGQPLDPHSPEAPALSEEYVSASTVAEVLSALGYDGEDNSQDIVANDPDDPYNGWITGNGVYLRAEPTTQSATVTTLYQNAPVQILETVTGQLVEANGQKNDQWYHVVTRYGAEGYVTAIYVAQESNLASPTFSVEDGYLIMTAGEGCEIRYTTDGTQPTGESALYEGPVSTSGTYRAVAVQDGQTSPVATITFAGGSLFTDFTSEDWYFSHIDQVVALGLFNGRGNEFDATTNITRGEFAAALANLAGIDTAAYAGTSSFTDVDASDWYLGAVNWVSAQGYMSGMGDGTFGADSPINREQICVALANYANLSYRGSAAAFQDDSSISSWAKDAVYACRELGIVSGMGDGTFAPKDNAQRAHACSIILKAYELGL